MAKEHFHTHRALIGFDEHGIPTVIAPAHNHKTDGDGRLAPTEAEFTSDYRQAVAAYRKTFPSRQEVQEETPDPAVRDLLSYAGEKGIETASAEITMVPENYVHVSGKDAEKVQDLIDALDESDDIQNVYSNVEYDEE